MCLHSVQMYVACGGAAAAVAATSYSPSHALTHVLAAAASVGPAAALREAGAVTAAARVLRQHDGSRVDSGALSAPACTHPLSTHPLSEFHMAGATAGQHATGAGLDAARGCGAGFLVDVGAAQAACLALAALCAGSPGARAELCHEGVRLPAAHQALDWSGAIDRGCTFLFATGVKGVFHNLGALP